MRQRISVRRVSDFEFYFFDSICFRLPITKKSCLILNSLRSSRFLSFPFQAKSEQAGEKAGAKKPASAWGEQKLGEKRGGGPSSPPPPPPRLTPSPPLPKFLLTPGARPHFRARFFARLFALRLKRKGKETAATQAKFSNSIFFLLFVSFFDF